MSGFDTLISIGVILAFVIFVGAKIYKHEKDSLDPIIDKIKGWFSSDNEGSEEIGPNDDFELSFRGQLPN